MTLPFLPSLSRWHIICVVRKKIRTAAFRDKGGLLGRVGGQDRQREGVCGYSAVLELRDPGSHHVALTEEPRFRPLGT